MASIFICYRREDSLDVAGRIADHLVRHFGEEGVFIDFDTIPPGEDFGAILEERVARCDVFLAVIGKHWLTIVDSEGQRRLDKPEDFVRLEISAALRRGVFALPVLVSGAAMPQSTQLPAPLAALARRQAVTIRNAAGFGQDVDRLKAAIQRQIEVRSRVEQLRSEAGSALEREDYAEAIAKFKEALQLSPTDRTLVGSIESAKAEQRSARRQQSHLKAAWRLVVEGADILLEGNSEVALASWEKAHKFAPDDERLSQLIEHAKRQLPRALLAECDRGAAPKAESALGYHIAVDKRRQSAISTPPTKGGVITPELQSSHRPRPPRRSGRNYR